jgi:hypothetical protein
VLAQLLWSQGRPQGVRDGVLLSGVRLEIVEKEREVRTKKAQSRHPTAKVEKWRC